MLGPRQWSPRTEYIVRQGILRRGIIIGALITVAGVLPELGEFNAYWRMGVVLLLAWALWAVVAGWLIGAFLWSRQTERREGGTASG